MDDILTIIGNMGTILFCYTNIVPNVCLCAFISSLTVQRIFITNHAKHHDWLFIEFIFSYLHIVREKYQNKTVSIIKKG